MGAAWLIEAPFPQQYRDESVPSACWGTVTFQWSIYLPRAASGFWQEWPAGALSSGTSDMMLCVCVRSRCSSKKRQWGASDTAFEGCCLLLVVDLVTTASQLWMRRRLKPQPFLYPQSCSEKCFQVSAQWIWLRFLTGAVQHLLTFRGNI